MEGRTKEALLLRGTAVKAALEAIPDGKLPTACRARLLKPIRGELNFVEKLGLGDQVLSSNFGHFEAIVQVLQHPSVSGICAVNHKFAVSSARSYVHVDMVGLYDGKAAWFVVSDRNPKLNFWIQSKIASLLQAAMENLVVKPSCIVFYFARGIERERSFEEEFNAYRIEVDESSSEVESGEWLLIKDEGREECLGNDWIAVSAKEKQAAVMYRIDIAPASLLKEEVFISSVFGTDLAAAYGGVDSVFYNILEDVRERWGLQIDSEARLVNLDTTGLIGLVSGISNDMASSIVTWSGEKLKEKFCSFGHFFKTQALLELERPFLPEVAMIFKQRQPMISQFAWEEFESIVYVVGGPGETRRAKALHDCMKQFIVPNNPSERVAALPKTGRIHDKHKFVFGTGDTLQAPTLTSNVSFVRAAISKGMALDFIEHRPLALTRD